MPLTTYSELQASVADWLNRTTLTSQIKDFIAIAESRWQDKLRARDMLARTTLAVSTKYTALPADFLAMESVFANDSFARPLGLLNAEQMAIRRKSTLDVSGTVTDYGIVGGELESFPTPGSATTLDIVYFQKITPLSDGSPTNWLLTKYPDLYLFGALISSAPFLNDDDRFSMWLTAHDARVEEINRAAIEAKHSGSTPRQKMRGIS